MKIEDVWKLRVPLDEEETPQHIIESIAHRKKKKAKARKQRKLAKTTPTTKNNRRHKLPGYRGRRRVQSCRSWR